MKNKKNVLLMILGIIGLIVITTGVTLAFFSYAKEGTTENTVTTGTLQFLYTEVDKVGAGISIEDALPISDSEGKAQSGAGKEFNFKVTSALMGEFDIPYIVTARKKNVDNPLRDEAVRIYLADTTGSVEKELLLDNYNKLKDYENRPTGITEKVIYNGLVPTGSTNYEKDFVLKMWLDESIDFSPVKGENGEDIYPYNGKEFTVTVNVYANAKVVTDSEIDMANTTAIDSIVVSDPNVQAEEASEEEEYDYIANVENEVDSVSLEIETTNPEAEVEVTRIENETAYNTKVQRLSTKVTFDLEEGENLFNIKILSANKQVEKEYVLNIYRALSCAYKPGDVVETFNYTGEEQIFNVPCTGTYKLEVYGGRGGGASYRYGDGCAWSYSTVDMVANGNASGNFNFTKDRKLYIYVGGTGGGGLHLEPECSWAGTSYTGSAGYNGGIVGTGNSSGSGGATHIALATGNYSSTLLNSGNILLSAKGGNGIWKGWGTYYTVKVNGGGSNYVNTSSEYYLDSSKTTASDTTTASTARITLVSLD